MVRNKCDIYILIKYNWKKRIITIVLFLFKYVNLDDYNVKAILLSRLPLVGLVTPVPAEK